MLLCNPDAVKAIVFRGQSGWGARCSAVVFVVEVDNVVGSSLSIVQMGEVGGVIVVRKGL